MPGCAGWRWMRKAALQYTLNKGCPGTLLCSTNLVTRLVCPQNRMSRPLHTEAAEACPL